MAEDSSIEPNLQDIYGKTALHYAAEQNDIKKVEKLLSLKADPNVRDNDHKTPLQLIAIKNVDESHFEVAERLLKAGTDVNASDFSGKRALFYLIERGNMKIVQLFLKFKADVHVMNYDKETLLFPAVKQNKNEEVVQLLIKLGLKVNHCNTLQRTPLHAVTMYNVDESHLKLAEILLKSGANPNIRDNEGQTPLWFLAKNGNANIFKLFLKFHANCHIGDIRGNNLLFPAVEYTKNAEIVQLLADQKLDVNQRNLEGKTPLHEAARNKSSIENKYKMAEILLKSGTEVNARDNREQTPLFCWIQKADLQTVNLFLKFNASVDVVVKNGWTLLFSAVSYNSHVEVVQLLIDLGLDVNQTCYLRKATPLHCAAQFNDSENLLEITETLLKYGASTNLRDSESRTPLWYFVKKGNVKIVELFLYYEGDFHVVDKKGCTLLFSAADYNNNADVVQLLVDQGLDVNHRCFLERTPLHLACESESDNLKIIKCLLKNGADLYAGDYKKLMPLICAASIFYGEETLKKKFSFIVEHTDFNNEIYEEVDALFHHDHPDYLILQHLAKLEVLKNPSQLHSGILNHISSRREYSYYYNECIEELKRAKNTKLRNSWVTFYNLLFDSRRKLKNYAGNSELIEDFEESDCEQKFPVYGATMVENVRKGIKRRELFDKSTVLLSECLPIFNPMHLIIKDVLDCVLSKKDLLKFCE